MGKTMSSVTRFNQILKWHDGISESALKEKKLSTLSNYQIPFILFKRCSLCAVLLSTAEATFLAQSMHIKLALPQAAWLTYFWRKISSVAPIWGTCIKDTVLRGQRKEKKAQHPAGFKPTTSLLWGVHSTAVLQPLPCCSYQIIHLTISALKLSLSMSLTL